MKKTCLLPDSSLRVTQPSSCFRLDGRALLRRSEKSPVRLAPRHDVAGPNITTCAARTKSSHQIIKFVFLTLITLHFSLFTLSAQSFEWELRLDTKFDNHEREKLELPTVTSKTYFSSRLAPVVGVGWESRNKNGTIGRHSMMAGGSVTLDFSSRPPYGRHLEPQLYYNFNSPNYSLYAGVFERRRLIGSYSRVTYSGVASFYDNIVQGLAMQYHGPGSRFEVALDWDGSQSETERESFRVLLAGDWNRAKQISMRWFEAGFSVDWYHLASRTGAGDGVVEHILGDARLGAAFEKIMPWFERLAISAGWLQSMDRDRAYGLGSWLSPGGVTVDVAVQKWRVGVRNRYYHGVTGPGKGVQMPLWSAYGSRIYKGDPIYASARTYNYTSIYWRPTIGRSVDLNLELGLHSNGVKTGFQQVLWVGVTLDNDFFRKK